jgi:hypothetical protein
MWSYHMIMLHECYTLFLCVCLRIVFSVYSAKPPKKEVR